MKKYTKIIVLFFLLLLSSAAEAEDIYSFLKLTQPLLISNVEFSEIKIKQTENYLNTLPGFTCLRTNFSDKQTRIACNSEPKAYTGSYKITVLFDSQQLIKFFEIQESHPDLDKKLINKNSLGFTYLADVIFEVFKREKYVEETERVIFFSNIMAHVFTTQVSKTTNCEKINSKAIACAAYIEKSSESKDNKFVLSLSAPDFFYKER